MNWRKVDEKLVPLVFAAAAKRSVECRFAKAEDGTVRCGTDASSGAFHEIVVEARLAQASLSTGLPHATRRAIENGSLAAEAAERGASRAFFVVMEGKDVEPGRGAPGAGARDFVTDPKRWTADEGGEDGREGGTAPEGPRPGFSIGGAVAAKLAARLATDDVEDLERWLSSGSAKARAASIRDLKRKIGTAAEFGTKGGLVEASGVVLEYVRGEDGSLERCAARPYATPSDRLAAAFLPELPEEGRS